MNVEKTLSDQDGMIIPQKVYARHAQHSRKPTIVLPLSMSVAQAAALRAAPPSHPDYNAPIAITDDKTFRVTLRLDASTLSTCVATELLTAEQMPGFHYGRHPSTFVNVVVTGP